MHGTDAADGQQGCNVGVVMHWTKHLLGLKPLTSPQAVDPHLPERIADVLIKVFPGALHVRWPTGTEFTAQTFISQRAKQMR